MGMKPVKIKLNNGAAAGMYILLDDDEVRYTNTDETRPPNRTYKIEIAIEAMCNNKRCRGKKTFNVPKGTSISKAVNSLLGKKQDLINELKERGTLAREKIDTVKIDIKDKSLNACYERFIAKKSINSRSNTTRVYKLAFETHLRSRIGKIEVVDIDEDVVQKIVNELINENKSANTIKGIIYRVVKQILQDNDVILNWKKIILPRSKTNRKYDKPHHVTLEIVKALKTYPHHIARGVFEFLLTGRRVNEVLYLKYDNINYADNTFTLPANITKTKKDFVFGLTPALITAIKDQKTTKGRIFKLEQRMILGHFKQAMSEIGIYDMVAHDIRSMVAQTALNNGANIYDVSKMLAHEKVATTEQAYVKGGILQATRAQNTVSDVLKLNHNIDIIDVEIVQNKIESIKNLFPKASDDAIQYAINVLEGKILPDK